MVIPKFLKEEYPFAQNKHALSDNLNLNYVDEGEGKPILMVHGNPTWSFYFRNLIKEFKKTHRVIVPDHIGCGLSDKPAKYDYTLQNHIENLDSLVKKLDLKEITLIVHDWGGAIGMGFATRNPERIKRVVITNTAAFLSKDIPNRIAICKAPLIGEFIVRAFNGFAWPATFMAVSNKLSKTIKKGFLLPYNNYGNRRAVARFVQDIPMKKRHRSYARLQAVEEKLTTLVCPKLVLWGAKDFCFNMKFYKRWQEIYPDAEFVTFENANHYLFEDAKEETISKIRSFISKESHFSKAEE